MRNIHYKEESRCYLLLTNTKIAKNIPRRCKQLVFHYISSFLHSNAPI